MVEKNRLRLVPRSGAPRSRLDRIEEILDPTISLQSMRLARVKSSIELLKEHIDLLPTGKERTRWQGFCHILVDWTPDHHVTYVELCELFRTIRGKRLL